MAGTAGFPVGGTRHRGGTFQVSSRAPMKSRALVFTVVALVVPAAGVMADEVSSGLFVRTDTDGTHVISPRVRARSGVVDDVTHADVTYTADVWTSASIDIRTAATRRVTEQRDEISAGIDRELDNLTLRASYRWSSEADYVSHGGSLSVSQPLAEGSATVETVLTASSDTVGRSGDATFERALSTVGAQILFSQLIDRHTVIQLSYELARREGFQSSPYRFVGIGGDGICAGTAVLCLPETHPAQRLRHALVARTRRAFGENLSGGLEYRFYADDWGLISNTAIAQLAWLPSDSSTLVLRYRFYTQTPASFYRSSYEMPGPGAQLRYVSRDRELSPMSSHRVALSWEHTFDLTDAGPTTRTTISLGGTVLGYEDFVGLDQVYGIDVLVAAQVEL